MMALATTALAGGPGDLWVVTASPSPRSISAPAESEIAIVFNGQVEPASVVALDTVWAFGRWSGTVTGTFSFPNPKTLVLTPDRPFSHGESVSVYLSRDIESIDGASLRAGGYSFQFWVEAKPAALEYVEVERRTTRSSPGSPTTAYGGLATDLDGDAYLDLTIVNEITADLRVFLNRADGSGTFEPFLEPTVPVGSQASPSEASDFDRDGDADVCVANINDASVSIVLGNGDGTFAPQQEIVVGGRPRGIAVLDADGDGDTDIVYSDTQGSMIGLLSNDGAGLFGPPTLFGTGTAGERGVASGDMNNDGLLDLVVGGFDDGNVHVWINDGDGTFTLTESRAAGGGVWMLGLGDVDGDGNEDVASVNASAGNAGILKGDGTGQLGPVQTYVPDPFPLATDLGDLDGDGDLDWVTSSYSGDWFLFRNDGTGTFAFDQEFPATQAASCALLFDADNDGGLDLALVDELEDEVIVMRNTTIFGDGFESGDVSSWSVQVLGNAPSSE